MSETGERDDTNLISSISQEDLIDKNGDDKPSELMDNSMEQACEATEINMKKKSARTGKVGRPVTSPRTMAQYVLSDNYNPKLFCH